MAHDDGGQGSRPDLEAYRRKRQAGRTPEPFAETTAAVPGGPVFVVQRHSARRLHYDLRLERGGVLASWAVPKGLPTAAGSKRLAVHTEDHPLSYATFEGVIPRGEYGAGTMDVYDRGVWEVVEERRDGGLTFRLHGDRLRGTWTLVPARLDGEERNWLLLRRATEGTDDPPRQVARYEPMLATSADDVPPGDGWLYEVKLDGFRVLARLDDGDPSLWSRNGKDNGERFRAVANDLGRGLRSPRIVVDGEICALDEAGRPSFQLLQNGLGALVYYVFDLLELEGERLLEWPLEERRALLESLVDETSATVRFSRGFTDGATLLRAAHEQGLEGVVAKRLGSRYVPGRRSPDWRKLKVRRREPFAVVGWTRGERSRERLGSLVLGAATDDGDLVWAGHVGSGLSEAEIDRLLQRLTPLARATSPLDRRERDPRLRRGRVTWVEPELRALVEFSEWTDEGRVRAPVYHGLVDADGELARVPGPTLAGQAGVDVPAEDTSSPTSLTPETYYGRVGGWVIPYLRDRPLALGGAVVADGSVGPEDVAGLVALLDGAWLQLAMPISRSQTPDEPDLVAFELTPGRRAPDGAAARVAVHIRDALAGLGLRTYPLAREDGVLHACVPVAAGVSYADTATFARAVAGAVCRAFPSDTAVAPSPVPSAGVLIDWRANAPGGTIPVPYVARAGGRVATCPPAWEELDAPGALPDLGPAVVAERVERLGDLFAAVLEGGQDLGRHLGRS